MLLVWAALLPVVGNPIIYLTCVSDYRVNIAQAWKLLTGKQVFVNIFKFFCYATFLPPT